MRRRMEIIDPDADCQSRSMSAAHVLDIQILQAISGRGCSPDDPLDHLSRALSVSVPAMPRHLVWLCLVAGRVHQFAQVEETVHGFWVVIDMVY